MWRASVFTLAMIVTASAAVSQDAEKSIAEIILELEAAVAHEESGVGVETSAAAVAARTEALTARAVALEKVRDARMQEAETARADIVASVRAALAPPPAGKPPADPAFKDLASDAVSVPAPEAGAPAALDSALTVKSVTQTPAVAASMDFALDGLSTPQNGRDPGFLRRILSRPNAVIVDASGAETTPAPFSIYYVYDDRTDTAGTRWLAIGDTGEGAVGWIRHEQSEDWRSMLVMEYAARTDARRPVLFFRSEADLRALVESGNGAADARAVLDAVAAGGNADGRVVTVEPDRGAAADQLYLMPIVDFAEAHFQHGSAGDVMLLELAGLTADAASREAARATESVRVNDGPRATDKLKAFRVGLVFVIDTTLSMGPYIEATKDFVRNVYAALDARGIADRFRIGVIGFRDNVAYAPGAAYVTRIYRDLGAAAPDDINEQIARIRPSEAPTRDWREDSFAGLRAAALDLDWGAVDARIALLVTDASARDADDDGAQFGAFGAASVRAIMQQQGIKVIALHLRTGEARRAAGDAEILRGEAQYREIGDYLPVEGNTARTFGRALDSVEQKVVETLIAYAGGVESLDGIDIGERDDLLDVLDGGAVLTEANASLAAQPIASELFRAQQAYLGAFEGAAPPPFYRAWAADIDLMSTRDSALEVSVLVTRAQLEDIAGGLDNLLRSVDDKTTGLGDFFTGAQAESGRAAADPKMSDFRPDYLDALPYKSRLGNITVQDFLRMGQDQEALLNDVRAKLTAYREVLRSDRRWMTVSPASQEQLYPLRLRDLP